MKKLSLLTLAAAGLLMVGCSDKDVVVDNTKNDYGLVEGESSWIAVGISMPGDPITRGITRNNEHLVDGLTTEFEVKSGTLYLFKGISEDAAKFFASYPINTTFSGNEANDSVPEGNNLGTNPNGFGEITTTSQKIVQEIDNPSLGVNDKLYAYVILNNGTATQNYANITASSTMTGEEFKKQQLKAIGIEDETKGFGAMGENGLVMTNVPISTAAGGDQNPSAADILTFTEIDKSAIYKTKAEAEADGAQMACIYVERAAVKVEVGLADGFGIQLDGDESVTTINASDVKWALGNVNFGGTNTTANMTGVGYYNTRQFDKTWLPYNNLAAISYLKYRMVGRTPFFNKANQSKHTPNLAYRTYFGKDPNYTGSDDIPYDASTGLLNYKLSDANEGGQYTLAPNDVVYTYENTFDENSQIWRNTTYVGVKVKIANADFYTMEGQPNTKLAGTTDVAAVVSTRLHDVINARKNSIQAAIEADLGKTSSTGRTISEGVTAVTFDMSVTVAFDADGSGKGYIATTGEQTYTTTLSLTNIKTNGTAASSADESAINALANNYIGTVDNPDNSKVFMYKGGIAYYSTRIQHFGQDETPWSAPGEAYNDYIKVYPANGQSIHTTPIVYGSSRANAWLGRWGIVRNNWYVLTLKKIEGIGSPVPEDYHGEIGNTPDDNPPTSYFISAEVHILPWAKRFQEVTF